MFLSQNCINYKSPGTFSAPAENVPGVIFCILFFHLQDLSRIFTYIVYIFLHCLFIGFFKLKNLDTNIEPYFFKILIEFLWKWRWPNPNTLLNHNIAKFL